MVALRGARAIRLARSATAMNGVQPVAVGLQTIERQVVTAGEPARPGPAKHSGALIFHRAPMWAAPLPGACNRTMGQRSLAMEPSLDDDQRPPAAITEGLAALLSNLIDYAGLLPPASLDMPMTVADYASYVAGKDAWLLERLVIPVSRLEEFEAQAAAHLPRAGEQEPWPISALVRAAGEEDLPDDLDRIAAFNERHCDPQHGLALIDVVELKADSARAIDDAIDLMPDDLYPFFELPSAGDSRGLIAALVGGEAGAKIRMGGKTAGLPLTPADVARFIATCAAADVPFKAIGGLHHPLTHAGEGGQNMEIGFLNLIIAAVLALNADPDEGDLIRVLEEGDIDAFMFDDAGLKWRDHRATVEEIEDTRLAFVASIACSSFDEPCRNLRAIGLL
jgi:hypothetical protein